MQELDHENEDYEINYEPERSMEKFHALNSRFKFSIGPVGVGKTTGFVNDVFQRMSSARAWKKRRYSRWMITRATYGELESLVCPEIATWIPEDLMQISYGKPIIGRYKQELPDGTTAYSQVTMVGMDRKNSMSRVAGFNGTAAWMNEVSESSQAVFDTLRPRVRRYPSKLRGGFNYGGIIGDLNSVTKKHWFYKLYRLMAGKPGWEFIFTPPPLLPMDGDTEYGSLLNMQPNPLAEGVIFQELGFDYWYEQLEGRDEKWIRRMILNEFTDDYDGDPVHHNFSKREHVAPAPLLPDPSRVVLVSFDWGFSGMAVQLGQYLENGRYVYDSFCVPNTTLGVLLNQYLKPLIFEKYRECRFVGTGDPSGGRNWKSAVGPFDDVVKFFSRRPGRLGLQHLQSDYQRYDAKTEICRRRTHDQRTHLLLPRRLYGTD